MWQVYSGELTIWSRSWKAGKYGIEAPIVEKDAYVQRWRTEGWDDDDDDTSFVPNV